MDRRKFLLDGVLVTMSTLCADRILQLLEVNFSSGFTSNRPPLAQRTFSSVAVENKINTVKAAILDEELAWMFENCYPNTLDTTVDFEWIDGRPDTFIITGDIDAMWLRDSTAQVWPYMPLINSDKQLKNLILGLINRQVKCVLLDPYANSFYKDKTRISYWAKDMPSPINGVHERKWEIDSLCYVIRLAYAYYKETGDASFMDQKWDKAMRLIVETFRTEQRIEAGSPYRFARKTNAMIDAPIFNGTGRPLKPNGLICSMFRPSDDATLYPFLIPSNLFAIQSLRQLSEMYFDVLGDENFSKVCTAFADEVENAVLNYGIVEHPVKGKIYAYEVDGFGNALFMDDANVPSLMSLAYLGIHQLDDDLYQNTRSFLLSDSNPYFLKGKSAEGQASPHTGKEKIWPMGIILRALTSEDKSEIKYCLQMLRSTHAGTGFMHEAFHKDDPSDFNRSWFAWANTLFGELILNLYEKHPDILKEKFD
jgi:meiotically up-regulated gene 157 (Mug157) protein